MTDSRLRQQTKSRLSAISADFRDEVQQEVDAMRASIDQRLTALTEVFSEQDALFDRLAQDVSDLVVGEAEAATQACQEVEAAQSQLRAAHAQAHIDIETLRTELDTTRMAFETQLAQAQVAQAETTHALAHAQEEIVSARREWVAQALNLDEARSQIQALEEDHAQLALAREVAEAHLEEEVQRRIAMATQLDAEREEMQLAKAEADSWADIRARIVALARESSLAGACRDRTSVSVDAAADDDALGPYDSPLEHAIAAAYGENSQDDTKHRSMVGDKIEDVLVDRVNQPLTGTPPVTEHPPSTQQTDTALAFTQLHQNPQTRQARRIKLNGEVEVLVDGVASVLVDLSTLGAQILSLSTLRPNRPVRIVLPRDEGSLACRGLVVWARLEPPVAGHPPLYRAGVRFGEIDASAIEAFVIQYGLLQMPAGTAVAR